MTKKFNIIIIIYLDEIFIYIIYLSSNYIKAAYLILNALKKYNWYINSKKYWFYKIQIYFLSNIVLALKIKIKDKKN